MGEHLIGLQQPAAAAHRAAEIAHDGGAKIVVDGAIDDHSILQFADVVRADQQEAEQLTGIWVHDVRSGVRAARRLLRQGPLLATVAVDHVGDIFTWDDQFLVAPRDDSNTDTADAFVAALTRALVYGKGPSTVARDAAAAANRFN